MRAVAVAAILFPPTSASRLTSRWERMWLRNQFLRGLLIAPGFAQWKIHRRLITLPAIELRVIVNELASDAIYQRDDDRNDD